MGHHIIDEVKQEKFIFSGKAKLIPILLIVLGAILAGVGAMQVRDNWDNVPQTEEHATATDADSHDTHAEEEHGDHHQTVAHAEEKHTQLLTKQHMQKEKHTQFLTKQHMVTMLK